MSTTPTKGRKIQIKQGMSEDYTDEQLDVGELGLILDTNDVRIGLADGSTMSLSGDSTPYVLPEATSTVLGGVKIGANINSSTGTISVNNSSTSTKGVVQLNDTLTSTATDQALTANQGKILNDKVQDLIDTGTTIPDASATQKGLMTTEMVSKLNSISSGANFTTVTDSLTSTSTSAALSANQGKILKDMLDSKATSANYTITVDTSWTGSVAPYTKTISLNGILATDNPIVFPIYSTTLSTAISQEENYYKISKITTSNNSITLTCFKEKPTVSLSLQVKVVR